MAKKRKPEPSPLIKAKLKEKEDELRQSWIEHRDGCIQDLKSSHGWLVASEGGFDVPRIFEGFVLQDLAGIHVAIEMLQEQLNAIRDD